MPHTRTSLKLTQKFETATMKATATASITTAKAKTKTTVTKITKLSLKPKSTPTTAPAAKPTTAIKKHKQQMVLTKSPHKLIDCEMLQEQNVINEIKSPNVNNNNKTVKKLPTNESNLLEKHECKKRKSYDPIKARQFIQQQQEKRKEELIEMAKMPPQRDVIKKRLNELKKNSLKIVKQNVQRARRCSLEATNDSEITIQNDAAERKRIGILRRPDNTERIFLGNNHIESPPDKCLHKNENNRIENNFMHDKNLELTIPHSESLKSSILEQKKENKIIENQTKTPPTHLPSLSSPPSQQRDQLNTSEPYWLRPTTVQMYPYNFIMALRKKLEQITYPSIQTVERRLPPMEYQKFSQVMDLQQQDGTQSEDYSTNFSSATLPTQQTKTSAAMNASSQQTNEDDDKETDTQDTLSISSGILSHSSPEKQTKTSQTKTNAPSPLSMDQIDGLQITSKNSSKISQIENERQSNAREHVKSFINFQRGNAYQDLKPLTIDVDDEITQSTENIDVNQMLNEFNENLSHVIKVNQQLHSMLSNPASQRSYSASANRTEQTSQKYSDDFDNVDVTKSHVSQSRSTRNSAEKMTQSNRNSTKTYSKSETPSFRTNESSLSTLKPTRDSVTEQIVQTRTNSISEIKTSKSSQDIVTEEIASETYKSSKRDGQNSNSIQSIHKHIIGEKEMTNRSIGSDIRGVFKQYELEYNEEINSSSWSDANRSLSSLGMCDQLIQSEKQKSEHLASLLKIREKNLIDRFKGQISWLELLKKKLKAKGLTLEISAVKKKQRALLMRLEKERKELHKTMKHPKVKSVSNSQINYTIGEMSTNINIRRSSLSLYENSISTKNIAIKAIEMPIGNDFERMLEKREYELCKRREYVEKLIAWHQRLDIEEEKVAKMEQIVMMISTTSAYNGTLPQVSDLFIDKPKRLKPLQHLSSSTVHSSLDHTSNEEEETVEKHQKHYKKIEKSLKALQNVSARSISIENDDIVEVSGRHLNKLWKRLTGEIEMKFIVEQMYAFRKIDLERLYEEAKMVVLGKFAINNDFKQVIDVSTSFIDDGNQNIEKLVNSNTSVVSDKQTPDVPSLDLKTSADEEEEEKTNQNESDQGYYFTTEDNFEPSNETITTQKTSSPIQTDDKPETDLHGSQSNIVDAEGQDQTIKTDTIEEIVENQSTNETIQSNETEMKEEDKIIDKTVLIEDISFPQYDVSLINETVQSDVSSTHHSLEQIESNDDSNKNFTNEIITEVPTENQSDSQIETNISNEEPISSSSSSGVRSIELEKRLIDLDESLKDLHETISRSPVFESNENMTLIEDSIPTETQKSSETESSAEGDEDNKENISDASDKSQVSLPLSEISIVVPIKTNAIFANKSDGSPLSEINNRNDTENAMETFSPPKYGSSLVIDYNKTKEAEALRRPPIVLDAEKKSPERNVSANAISILREIPNKPPPPYPTDRVTNAARSIPSDERIKQIVFNRIEELYEKPENPVNDTTFILSPKNDSTISSPITINVFERVISDACEEIWTDLDSKQKHSVGIFKQPLCFYKPPDRLKCTQEFALIKILKLMGRKNASKLNGSSGDVQRSNARFSPMSINGNAFSSRRKRDVVDEILIQEMYEEEQNWSNFDLEELEVRNSVKDLNTLLEEDSSIENSQSVPIETEEDDKTESRTQSMGPNTSV